MTRITPEQVERAYIESGLRPEAKGWITFEKSKGTYCGNALSACVLAARPNLGKLDFEEEMSSIEGEKYVAEVLDISNQYLDGYVRGFSGEDVATAMDKHAKYIQDDTTKADVLLEIWNGYQDGVAARLAVFESSKQC